MCSPCACLGPKSPIGLPHVLPLLHAGPSLCPFKGMRTRALRIAWARLKTPALFQDQKVSVAEADLQGRGDRQPLSFSMPWG